MSLLDRIAAALDPSNTPSGDEDALDTIENTHERPSGRDVGAQAWAHDDQTMHSRAFGHLPTTVQRDGQEVTPALPKSGVEEITSTAGVSYNGTTVAVVARQTNVTPLYDRADRRTYALLINSGNVNVFVGTRSQCASGNGFLLVPGARMEPKTKAAVYCVAADGTAGTVPVSVWTEEE